MRINNDQIKAQRSRSGQTSRKRGAVGTAPAVATVGDGKGAARWAAVCLALVLGVVYITTLMPGVDAGDSAELQYMSPLLGVCHPPGYQIEICCGKLFSLLPIGPNVAWRINFMMAVSGVIGCLALYGAVRRISGQIIPGLVAGATLGFSSIYWSFSLVAEAYVFYGMFLLLGIYCVVRFVESNKAGWLYLTALFLGVCMADRASELFVLPGFLLLWLVVRKHVRLSLVRIVVGLLVFVLPFAFSVSFFMARSAYYPQGRELLHGRDSALRNEILSGKFTPPQRTDYEQLRMAVQHCLGLTYKRDAKFNYEQIKADIDKYLWLLSGKGLLKDNNANGNQANNAQGKGSSIGLLGLLLVGISLIRGRGRYGWVLLGLTMFLGNLVFILWHHRWDNMTFIIPGLAGLSLLAGLGAAGKSFRFDVAGSISEKSKSPAKVEIVSSGGIWRVAFLIVPLVLLIGNYNKLDRSNEVEKHRQKQLAQWTQTDFPQNSVLLGTNWPVMTWRYLFYIEAGREDMQIIYADNNKWPELINYFRAKGEPVFIKAEYLPVTPHDIANVGFVRVDQLRRK